MFPSSELQQWLNDLSSENVDYYFYLHDNNIPLWCRDKYPYKIFETTIFSQQLYLILMDDCCSSPENIEGMVLDHFLILLIWAKEHMDKHPYTQKVLSPTMIMSKTFSKVSGLSTNTHFTLSYGLEEYYNLPRRIPYAQNIFINPYIPFCHLYKLRVPKNSVAQSNNNNCDIANNMSSTNISSVHKLYPVTQYEIKKNMKQIM